MLRKEILDIIRSSVPDTDNNDRVLCGLRIRKPVYDVILYFVYVLPGYLCQSIVTTRGLTVICFFFICIANFVKHFKIILAQLDVCFNDANVMLQTVNNDRISGISRI